MMNEPQQSFAAAYFRELANTLTEADLAMGLGEPNVSRLMSPEALRTSEAYDATNYAAVTAVSLNPFRRFISRFTENADRAKESLNELYGLYSDARQRIESYSDVIDLLVNRRTSNDHDLDTLILNYLVIGKYKTRLGEEISLPGADSQDKTLDTLLGILRIISEDSWNSRYKNNLPWLADDESESATRFKMWEIKASSLGDNLASSLGRAAAVGATGLLSPLVKLPDEVTIAVAFIAGVQGRKLAELKMHQYLLDNPNVR